MTTDVQRPHDLPRPAAILTRRHWLVLGSAVMVGMVGMAGMASAAHGAELPDLIAASRASVLPVGTFSALNSPRFSFRGSGFVVGDGNHLITNAHVLPDAGTLPTPQMVVLVGRADGSRDARMATVLAEDRVHDLALLRIDGAPLPALQMAAAASVREGTAIALMGFPIGGVLGYSMVTHRGIVASITTVALPSLTAQRLDAKTVARLRDGPFAVYQLDATAYPGNSGGPLLDAGTGEVIGIINMVLVRSTRESALSNPTGITYAIPAQHAQDLLKSTP